MSGGFRVLHLVHDDEMIDVWMYDRLIDDEEEEEEREEEECETQRE